MWGPRGGAGEVSVFYSAGNEAGSAVQCTAPLPHSHGGGGSRVPALQVQYTQHQQLLQNSHLLRTQPFLAAAPPTSRVGLGRPQASPASGEQMSPGWAWTPCHMILGQSAWHQGQKVTGEPQPGTGTEKCGGGSACSASSPGQPATHSQGRAAVPGQGLPSGCDCNPFMLVPGTTLLGGVRFGGTSVANLWDLQGVRCLGSPVCSAAQQHSPSNLSPRSQSAPPSTQSLAWPLAGCESHTPDSLLCF
ncbi:alpha-2B adrenergic receptor [Platysternon megacephalum]|uniref:Alpha-2B adrenergic receptor n=1 Tax=Platysternon megacephalum TaxID=55544 RepID=A0A4D9DS37_9SAUR|nr:alpha-2B adrenergic receptor [Platysternon megacephalum]